MRCLAVSLSLVGLLHAATPQLAPLDPPGGQAGKEVRVKLRGERLSGLDKVLWYQSGIELRQLDIATDGKSGEATLLIAPDAPLGEHVLRLAGPSGLTELRIFSVGELPVHEEAEPNDPVSHPQRVPLGVTVHGVIESEDEDAFLVSLKKGERFSAEVEAMRLGGTMFDASLRVLDAGGKQVAACDDAPLLRTDAYVSLLAPEDGEYRVVLREAAYEGGPACRYRLHLGTFPRPGSVRPLGGKPGEAIEFTFHGDPAGPFSQRITLPAQPNDAFEIWPERDGLRAPSPHRVTVSPMPCLRDSEASLVRGTAPQIPAFPHAVHGVIDPGSREDWFRFPATKGSKYVIRSNSRILRSPLDPVLAIHDAGGKWLAGNDDQGGLDSVLPWTCPNDGVYAINIRDHLSRSGEDFAYRIEISAPLTKLACSLPVVERNNSQKWKTFPVPQGGRYAALVNLSRENLSCEAIFACADLPAGVTMSAPRILKNMNSFPVVFEAKQDAPIGAALHKFTLGSAGMEPPVSADLIDTVHHVEVNNQGAYHSSVLDRIPVAVTEAAPFRVELVESETVLARAGTTKVKVRIERMAGFKGKVVLRSLWHPPGVSGPVTLDVPPDQSEALYELNATAEAATGTWPICLLGEGFADMGPVLSSSAMGQLRVVERWLTVSLAVAAGRPGEPSAMLGKIEHLRPFEGEATLTLGGLPHGVGGQPQTIPAGQTEIVFPLEISNEAKIGKHSGIFCQALVHESGRGLLQQCAAGGMLRIDAKSEESKAPGKPHPDAKPLSRLEQLRKGTP